MSIDFSETEWEYEAVGGSTLAAVAQAISPKQEAALTEWFPHYDYQTTGDAISSAAVVVKTRVTMPQWSGYGDVSQVEKDEWDRFCAALRTHELGHVDLIFDRLSALDERLVGVSVDEAKKVWKDALDTLKSASDAYDNATDHGRNQGTVIDVNVGGAASD